MYYTRDTENLLLNLRIIRGHCSFSPPLAEQVSHRSGLRRAAVPASGMNVRLPGKTGIRDIRAQPAVPLVLAAVTGSLKERRVRRRVGQGTNHFGANPTNCGYAVTPKRLYARQWWASTRSA